jgi:hypothetical protein
MDIACPRCHHPHWVGLRFCTRCGQRLTGYAPRPPAATHLDLAFDQPVNGVLPEQGLELFPAFGQLLLCHHGELSLLAPDTGDRLRPLGRRPGGAAGGPIEALAVDRWLVVRHDDALRILAAPFLRTPRVQSLLTAEAQPLPMPAGTAARLRNARLTGWRSKLGSVARLGSRLAALVAEGQQTRLYILDLDGPEPEGHWEVGALRPCAVLRLPPGAWHIERGAAGHGAALLLSGDAGLCLVRHDAGGGPDAYEQHLFESPVGTRLRPGQAVITDHGIAALADTDSGRRPLLFSEPGRAPLPIIAPDGVTPENIDGLEPRFDLGARTVTARVRGVRHQLNYLVPRFEVDCLTEALTNRIEEELPGGVIYRSNDWETLRLRGLDYDVPLPVNEPRDAPVRGALEGRRLWLITARNDGPGSRVRALDWATPSGAAPAATDSTD